MKRFMPFAIVLFAILALLATTDNAVAKDKKITVMVVQGDQVLTTEVASTQDLSELFVVEESATGRGHLKRSALEMTLKGQAKNLRERIKLGGGSPVSPMQDTLLRSPIMDDAGPISDCESKCLNVFRSDDGQIICAGSCRNCYVEKCTP